MIREWNEESLDHRNALLYAMGISEEDAKRPVIGLVNSWNEMNPGHFPFDKTVIQEMKDEILMSMWMKKIASGSQIIPPALQSVTTVMEVMT